MGEFPEMATLKSPEFNVLLGNVPILNLRSNFNDLLALFRSEYFHSQFRGHRGASIPIKTHYFTWHGRPEVLLTYLVRDAIVAFESAVSGAVFFEAGIRGTLKGRILEAVKNPFSLPGNGTADRILNRLPSLIDRAFSLKERMPDTWERARLFYKEVRNPIFHAYEISKSDPEPVWQIFEFIWTLFQWLNSWHDIGSVVAQIQFQDLKFLTEIPNVPEHRANQIIPNRRLDQNPERDAQLPPDLMQAPDIEDVLGMHLPPEAKVCLTMQANDGRPVNMELSAHAAMKLLAYLAVAHKNRGWDIPDRL